MLADTDYLVVGAGATGLAFVDALVAGADVEVAVVDRQPAPGGHWLRAYPFVRLHTPSAYYGVNSLALGDDSIDQAGENAGFYERATGFWITTLSQTGSGGSGPARRGSMTAATFSRWNRWARSWRGYPWTPRPAPAR